MSVCILVPRRRDGGRRDELWAWCRAWWESHYEWPIFEAFHENDGGFNVAAARNAAARDAGDWTVALLIDGDVLLADPAQAELAVQVAATTGRVTFAHDRWRSLDRPGSDRVMSGWLGDWGKHVRTTIEFSYSNAVAIPRPLWDDLGGQDERFVGWGFEDMAFKDAALTLGGGLERIHGDVFHLWHPRSPERQKGQPHYEANKALSRRYRRAVGDPDAMRTILQERAR